MIIDRAYQSNNFKGSYIDHKYSEKVHILDNPYAQTLLAKLCKKETVLPQVNSIVKSLYEILMIDMI